jgi:hypothetical protein
MPRLDEAAREKNRKFIERLLAEGWNQEGDFIVHPTDRDIRVLWRPGSGELFFSPQYGEALKSENLDLKGNADPRIFELKSVRIIEEGLRAILLPNVIRPALGPHDPATEELVSWAITYHVYSEIAHVRTILAGFLALVEMKNVPSAILLSRHVFEWTALACYLHQNLMGFISQKMWQQAFDLLLQSDTGNQWARNHGPAYETLPFPDEILDPIEVNKLIAAYAKYQKKTHGKSKTYDSYGFLSEFAHPNSACLAQYRDSQEATGIIVQPPTQSTFGSIKGFIIEWLMFMQELLGFANENEVREKLIGMFPALAELAK